MIRKGHTKKIVAVISLVLIAGGIISYMNPTVEPNDDSGRIFETTEHVDEKSGQRFTEVKPVGDPEPTYQEVNKPTPETPAEQPAPEVFNAQSYTHDRLRDSLPAVNNETYMSWQLPCMNELIESTIGWDKTQADYDKFFSDMAKYTSVCSALQVYKASGNY